MMGPEQVRGVYSIMPTPAKEGADRWDASDTVDLDETARLVEQLITDGVDGIIALGTMGECATTSQQDYENFVDCVLSTTSQRVPTFIGATALGTHEIVRRIRFLRERRATGTLLGIPMWQPATLEMAVDFYATISKAFPDFAIMVYANTRAFRYDFGVEFWRRIASQAPSVICSKFSIRKIIKEAAAASQGKVIFVSVVSQAHAFSQLAPELTTACWIPAVGPQPAKALMKAILSGDRANAEKVAKDAADKAAESLKSAGASVEVK
jgi:trans-o-hydroxybenzylidenepyruvate hydratase-aldolase